MRRAHLGGCPALHHCRAVYSGSHVAAQRAGAGRTPGRCPSGAWTGAAPAALCMHTLCRLATCSWGAAAAVMGRPGPLSRRRGLGSSPPGHVPAPPRRALLCVGCCPPTYAWLRAPRYPTTTRVRPACSRVQCVGEACQRCRRTPAAGYQSQSVVHTARRARATHGALHGNPGAANPRRRHWRARPRRLHIRLRRSPGAGQGCRRWPYRVRRSFPLAREKMFRPVFFDVLCSVPTLLSLAATARQNLV